MKKKKNNDEFVLIEGNTEGPIRFCYHLEELPQKIPIELSVKRQFRIVCKICKHHVNEDLAKKELIFELDKMAENDVKYAILAKGMAKVSEMMLEKKITKIWEEDFLINFMKMFETKKNTEEELYSDLIFSVKHFQFDEELYKFTMFSPEYEMVFHPKRNINQIDVRFILERLVPIFSIYHKIINPGKSYLKY